jgi:CRP-like cAMP-binding protein
MSFALIYTATIMPYRIAFDTLTSEFWTGLEYSVMALFTMDLCMNFVTGFYSTDGSLVHSLPAIARHYAAGWLVVDLVACFPFNLIGVNGDMSSSGSGYSNVLKLVRVPQLYRLLRLSRLIKALKSSNGCLTRLQDYFSLKSSILRLFSFFVSMLTGVHLMACLWCFLPSLEVNPTQSWVYILGLQDSESSSIYVAAFYWAVTTLTTVGYGDISAHTNLERLVAVCWMVFGIFFFSFTIGSLTAMVTSSDTHETLLTQKIALVEEFSKYAHLTPDLRTRLKHALSYSSSRTGFSWADRRTIFTELPKDLKYEVAMMMHQGAAAHVQFFEKREREFVAEVVPFLVPVLIEEKEFVYKQGEHAGEMYFMVLGRCVVNTSIKGEVVQLRVIPSGAHFGELDVIEGNPRQYEVQALQQSHLLTLSKQLLRDIQQDFPNAYSELLALAETRKELYQRLVTQFKQAKDLHRQDTLKRTKTSELMGMKRLSTMEIGQDKTDLAGSVSATAQKIKELNRHVEGVKQLLRTQLEDLVGLVADKHRR